jgi:hypothetical protein
MEIFMVRGNVRLGWLLVGIALLAGRVGRADPARPDLGVALGERNEGVGLRVPSGGDGENAPERVQGSAVRRVTGKDAHYLYVAIDHPAYRQGPVDLYVSAEVFDDGVTRVSAQYDQASEHPNIGTCYTAAESAYLLVGSGRWRTLHFHLPQLRLGHGQNGGADFRFSAPNVAFRSLAVSPVRPAGFATDLGIDPEALRHVAVTRPAGMELTYGNDAGAADAALFKALSVSSVESYVDWADRAHRKAAERHVRGREPKICAAVLPVPKAELGQVEMQRAPAARPDQQVGGLRRRVAGADVRVLRRLIVLRAHPRHPVVEHLGRHVEVNGPLPVRRMVNRDVEVVRVFARHPPHGRPLHALRRIFAVAARRNAQPDALVPLAQSDAEVRARRIGTPDSSRQQRDSH